MAGIDGRRAGRTGTHAHARWFSAGAALVALALAGCTSNSGFGAPGAVNAGSGAATAGPGSTGAAGAGPTGGSAGAGGSAPSTQPVPTTVPPTPPTPPAPAVRIAASPAGDTGLNPTTPVVVSAANGTLQTVRLINSEGTVVKGVFSPDHSSWRTSEVLGYDRTYRLTAAASDRTGESVEHLARTLRTVTPSNYTMPYLDDIYGSPLVNGATYGVGMIPVVHFDEPITDRAAAERALTVTTAPHVDGSWTWATDQDLHWRPKAFYRPGTRITIAAKVYGVEVGDGLYGQADKKISYRIGASHVSIADDRTHTVKVYFDGKLQRTMPTSMGKHEGETVNGHYISFWTMRGTYTVLGHENPAHMCSASYGLPVGSPGSYPCEDIPWSTKISTDGIYLHELDSTLGAQGSYDTSHGCLNLNHDNAEWYYETARVGDVVQVIHMHGAPKIALYQGGDWSVAWKTWTANSALAS